MLDFTLLVTTLACLAGGVSVAFYFQRDRIYRYCRRYLERQGWRAPRYVRPSPSVYAAPIGLGPPCECDGSDNGIRNTYAEIDTRMQNMMERITGRKPQSTSFEDQIKAVELERGSKVIFINHGRRSSALSSYGLSFLDSTDVLSTRDATDLIDILRELDPDTPLDIVLNTTGGSLTAAEIMTKALLRHDGEICVYIPHHALSAGTVLALVGNEIYLERNGWMSQADPQLGYGFSASSVLAFPERTSVSWMGEFLQFARNTASKAMDRTTDLVTGICMARGYSKEDTEKVVGMLVTGRYNHDKPFTAVELEGVVHNLHEGIPDSFRKLYEAHSERR